MQAVKLWSCFADYTRPTLDSSPQLTLNGDCTTSADGLIPQSYRVYRNSLANKSNVFTERKRRILSPILGGVTGDPPVDIGDLYNLGKQKAAYLP